MSVQPYEQRGDELARLIGFLDEARSGRGGLVVVQGEPGIGKTALLRSVAAHARSTGALVVTERSVDLDAGASYAGALGVLARMRASGALDGVVASPVVVPMLAGRPPEVGDPFVVRHALTELVLECAESTPMVLLLDDAHWTDDLTLGWLAHLAAHAPDARLAVVVAARGGADGARPALERLPGPWIALAPLRVDQVRSVVQRAVPDAAPALVEACRVQTGGNPLLLGELLRDVVARDLTPDAVGNVVPDGAVRGVVQRMSTLSPLVRDVLGIAAVAGDGAAVRHVAAVADADVGVVRSAVDELVGAGFLVGGPDIDFVHPLVRRAVVDQLPRGRRSGLHRRLGEVLLAEGAADRGAAHLRSTEPAGDPWLVEQLRTQAQVELRRGAPAVSAALLERALAEPPTAERAADLLGELGRAEHLVGRPCAVEHLRSAYEKLGPDRTDVVCVLAEALTFGGDVGAAAGLLHEAREGATTREAVLDLDTTLLVLGQIDHDLAEHTGARLESAAQSGGGDARSRMLRAVSAYQDTVVWRGTAVAVGESARAAFAGGLVREAGSDTTAVGLGVMALALSGHVDTALEVLAEAEQDARERGSARGIATVAALRARVALLRGELQQAETDATTSTAIAVDAHRALLPFPAACLVMALTEQGRWDAAEHELTRLGLDGPLPSTGMAATLLWARASLRRSEGRYDEALADLAAAGSFGRGRAPWPSAWMPEVIATYAAAGRDDEARALATAHTVAARAWGSPVQLAAALHREGMVVRDDTLLGAALEAVPEHAVLLKARIQADLGAVLRRSNRRAESRPLLAAAWETADRVHAMPLAQWARAELAATGARPRSVPRSGASALTASERRVAELARAGRTNTEIARDLFITRKTVEKHLSSAYLKLAIGSRAELDAALGDEGATPASRAPGARR